MIRLALKMLFGDTAKYVMLVVGLVFSTFLMTQQISVFFGLMRWTSAVVRNVPAPLWIVEPSVEQINELNSLRDTDLGLVRSVNAVEWAMPVYVGLQRARLSDGSLKTINLIGIDPSSLAGSPPKLLEGKIEALRLPHTVVLDTLSKSRMKMENGISPGIGDIFEINDQEARVVGMADADQSFTGAPFVWTTYERAMQYVPPQRKMLSAVIASPKAGMDLDQAAREIEQQTGLKVFVNKGFGESPRDFSAATIWWYVKNTGIPISFGTTVIVGLIVGIAICCQTFYAFVLENMRHLGALKAMGTSTLTLCGMLLAQAFTAGLIGFGCGLFLVSLFARTALANKQPPFYMPWQVPVGVFFVIMVICLLSAMLGIWRVARLEAAAVFRGA